MTSIMNLVSTVSFLIIMVLFVLQMCLRFRVSLMQDKKVYLLLTGMLLMHSKNIYLQFVLESFDMFARIHHLRGYLTKINYFVL